MVFSRNAKKAYTDQSILQTFLLCLGRNVPQTFKSSSCKTSFSSVYIIDTTSFDKCFFIPCDDWKTLFFIQIYHYPEVQHNRHVASVLKEVRILYPLSTQ